MADFQSGKEQTTFVVDEVTNIIKETVEGAIGGSGYQDNKVNQWTSTVVEQCLNQLTKLGKPFKYIVTGNYAENGAGLHTCNTCKLMFWDNSTDGNCTVRWEKKTMFCIVSLDLETSNFIIYTSAFTLFCGPLMVISVFLSPGKES